VANGAADDGQRGGVGPGDAAAVAQAGGRGAVLDGAIDEGQGAGVVDAAAVVEQAGRAARAQAVRDGQVAHRDGRAGVDDEDAQGVAPADGNAAAQGAGNRHAFGDGQRGAGEVDRARQAGLKVDGPAGGRCGEGVTERAGAAVGQARHRAQEAAVFQGFEVQRAWRFAALAPAGGVSGRPTNPPTPCGL